MPDRRHPNDVPERIERLSRALDRVAADQPAPVLDESELQDLVDLAGRLRRELPRDIPDPGWRADLKAQLGAPERRELRRPVAAGHARRVAFPYSTAIGAIAAVLVAAIAVGTLAVWLNNDSSDNSPQPAAADGSGVTRAVGLATTTAVSATLIASTTISETQSGTFNATEDADPTATVHASAPTATAQLAQGTRSATVTAETPSPATAGRTTATLTGSPTAQPTGSTLLAEVPPVDAEHLEPGPVPAADGGGEPPSTAVAVSLEAPLPNLDDTAPLYTLVPPEITPETLVAEVADALGIDGPVVKATDARNHVQYWAEGSNGATFVWTPETGAFSFSIPDTGTPTPSSGTLTADQAVENTLAWLDSIGYPTDSLDAPPMARPSDDGSSWSVELWTDSVPYNSFGHPLGVIVTLNAAGHVTGGTGFWLNLDGQEDVPILSAADAWQAIASRHGYWTGGGISAGGGKFSVDTIFLGYTLTRKAGDPDLIYQPTIIAQGDFTSPNGDSTRITVYLQATK